MQKNNNFYKLLLYKKTQVITNALLGIFKKFVIINPKLIWKNKIQRSQYRSKKISLYYDSIFLLLYNNQRMIRPKNIRKKLL